MRIKGGYIILIVFLFGLLLFFGGIREILEKLVEEIGFLGLFFVVILLDITFVQPLSPALFMVISIIGGLNWFWVFIVGSTASIIAGIADYYFGKKLGIKFLEKYAPKKKINKAKKHFEKHADLAIVLGSITPVPYSIICWISGITEIKFFRFLRDSLITRFGGFFLVALLTYFGYSII